MTVANDIHGSFNFNSVQENEMLLLLKGYFDEKFRITKPPGVILDEFNTLAENCKQRAIASSGSQNFYLKLTSFIGSRSEQVDFTFKYKYLPGVDTLMLTSLRANLGTESKLFLLGKPSDLPRIETAHRILSKRHQDKVCQMFKRYSPRESSKVRTHL